MRNCQCQWQAWQTSETSARYLDLLSTSRSFVAPSRAHDARRATPLMAPTMRACCCPASPLLPALLLSAFLLARLFSAAAANGSCAPPYCLAGRRLLARLRRRCSCDTFTQPSRRSARATTLSTLSRYRAGRDNQTPFTSAGRSRARLRATHSSARGGRRVRDDYLSRHILQVAIAVLKGARGAGLHTARAALARASARPLPFFDAGSALFLRMYEDSRKGGSVIFRVSHVVVRGGPRRGRAVSR